MTQKSILKEFLSTTAEIHAASMGLYAGISETRGAKMPTDNQDVELEPHYWAGGYVVGTLLKWGVAVFIIIRIT